ncbi:craniofacial development protein 2-like protein [Plakobranchus ocellatus]|uniref:Craniofacial development protein 2-like protein n=1 Tax=Plakobranchus ocellatus TaxID=259542 RepID=A0AAV3YSF6_9GAST|nr:craniofacial development protein 2-like protein [Plakobranchus ocellatus]
MGNFNSKVGEEKVENIIGPFGTGEMNARGDRLTGWCEDNKFIVSKTWFENHPRRSWTWKSPADRSRNQVDYILIHERFRNSMKSSKSMSGADCGDDHVPVIESMKVKLKKLKKSKRTPRRLIKI